MTNNPPPDVPHHVVVTGNLVEYVPLTPAEIELQASGVKAADERRAAEQAEREQIRQQVAAHPDPLVQLLAERAGLL